MKNAYSFLYSCNFQVICHDIKCFASIVACTCYVLQFQAERCVVMGNLIHSCIFHALKFDISLFILSDVNNILVIVLSGISRDFSL